MVKRKSNNQPAKTKNTEAKSQQLSRHERDPGTWLPAPGNLIRRFRDEMDRVFEDFGFDNLTRSLPNPESFGLGIWAPEIEVFERGNDVVVRADLPGLTKDDVRIDLTERAITIEGERRQEHEENEDGYYRSERSYGHFSRRIPLPDGVDIDTAQAQFHDGVLEVTFATPERKERKSRKLEVTGESTSARAKAAGR